MSVEDTQPPRGDLKLDARRETIIRNARHAFMSHGYAAARIEPVARESSVSTATLYGYFPSKADLFAAVIENAAVDFADRMKHVSGCVGTPRERLVHVMTAYADFMGDRFVRSVFRLVMAERPRFRDVALDFFERGRRDFGGTVMATLKEMKDAGQLTFDKPSWAAGQLMGMVEHPVFFMPMVTGDEVTPSRTTAQIVEDVVETFLARYGVDQG